MNRIKPIFYQLSAFLSGSCLVIMTVLIVMQIIARFFGLVIPSSEDFAGWLLSATIFFGLAYTFQQGGHIRVNLLLLRLSAKHKKYAEFFNIIVGLLISAYLAYYTFFTVYESFDFDDVTDTYIALPLWIVQLPMAIGSTFLFLALLDGLVERLMGKEPQYVVNEQAQELEG